MVTETKYPRRNRRLKRRTNRAVRETPLPRSVIRQSKKWFRMLEHKKG